MLPKPLHAPETITCSRIHYMLPNPLHAPESITWSRIHYMLPNPLHAPESMITWSRIHYMPPNPLHATSVHCCQSMGSGPGHRRRQRRSDRCVARLARLARAVNSPYSVGFNLQDNIIFQLAAIRHAANRWGSCQHEVLAQLKSSSADGGWDKWCLKYPGCHC